MYLQLVLVAALAFSGLAGSAHKAQDSEAPRDRVVGPAQAVAGAGANSAGANARTVTPTGLHATGARSDRVVLKDLDIVVSPVKPSHAVVTPGGPLEAQAVAGVVVADQLVAPKRVESEVVNAKGFQTLGLTWPQKAQFGDLGAEVRTRTAGKWSRWVDLERGGGAPDVGTPDAARALRGGTEPLPIGNADAVQLAFAATAKGGPSDLNLTLLGSAEPPVADRAVGSTAVGGASIQTAAYSSAAEGPSIQTDAYSTGGGGASIQTDAYPTGGGGTSIQTDAYPTAMVQATGAPTVITRAEWGAPAQGCAPGVAPSLVGATVHHTAGPNTYANVAQAKQQIRNDAIYHISALGWCDIGYNFIVDKFGNIYEGRAGSLTGAVVGAHAGGFNTGTVGVSMLGTYDAAPTAAMQRSVAQIIGWRLGAYGINPSTSMTYFASGGTPGSGQKFFNRNVTLPRLFAHRDVWSTACPGNGGYAALPNIRAMASEFSYSQRFIQARAVVRALYADLLLRPVDPTGLAGWSAMLAGGTGQPALVGSLTKSGEYVQLRIGQAYLEVLGRAPEPGGLAAWRREILAGRIPVDDVQRRFYASQEFVGLSGGTANGYVGGLYLSILGRAASQAEADAWAPSVGDQAGRSKITNGIWFSMEAAMHRVGNYYQLFLKRPTDLAGQTRWAQVLLRQGEGAVRTGLAGSAEYRLLALARFFP